ncbi:hypothetical protein Tco_0760494 [Tanacetum coccineum]
MDSTICVSSSTIAMLLHLPRRQSKFVAPVSEPCQRLLDSDFGSVRCNHSVRGPVVLDFGTSEVWFDSCEPLVTVGHSESYIGRDYGNLDVRGPMVLEFEKCVVRSVGDDTELVGVEACNSRNRDGCNVLGTSFVGDYYVDYSRQSATVWPPGESSSGVLSGIQTGTSVASPVHTNTGDQNEFQQRKIHGVCKRQERKRARSLTVGNGGGEFGDVMLDTVNHGDSYIDIGDCHWVCEYCRAAFWYGERVKRYGNRARP